MMRVLLSAFVVFACAAQGATAGFDSWTTDVKTDPFSGGERVTIDLSTSMRSGVVIICDAAQKGVTVRAIPGFAFEQSMGGYEPLMEFAIDGERVLSERGRTGAVGDNVAAAEVTLSGDAAQKFVDLFAKAKKQIAIKDGISDRPLLLTARGTTKAGAALVKCMGKQQ